MPRSPTQEEDKTYLKEVHAEAIQYNGLTVKHFETFCKHFEVGGGEGGGWSGVQLVRRDVAQPFWPAVPWPMLAGGGVLRVVLP